MGTRQKHSHFGTVSRFEVARSLRRLTERDELTWRREDNGAMVAVHEGVEVRVMWDLGWELHLRDDRGRWRAVYYAGMARLGRAARRQLKRGVMGASGMSAQQLKLARLAGRPVELPGSPRH